jgi:hypothetical protein
MMNPILFQRIFLTHMGERRIGIAGDLWSSPVILSFQEWERQSTPIKPTLLRLILPG